MAKDRYSKDAILNFGVQYGTARATNTIRQAISTGRLTVKTSVLRGWERLDTLAGVHYGDSQYWWILAAASNIGWALQVPPGTVIYIPKLNEVLALVS